MRRAATERRAGHVRRRRPGARPGACSRLCERWTERCLSRLHFRELVLLRRTAGGDAEYVNTVTRFGDAIRDTASRNQSATSVTAIPNRRPGTVTSPPRITRPTTVTNCSGPTRSSAMKVGHQTASRSVCPSSRKVLLEREEPQWLDVGRTPLSVLTTSARVNRLLMRAPRVK
jgi:hypothetical protein